MIGAPLTYASEREFLALLVDTLDARSQDAVILSNWHVGGRQIDFLVAQRNRTTIFEVKQARSKLKGGVNGHWARQARGEWVVVGNYYVQALEQKYAIRDAYSRHIGNSPSYPNSVLVFLPGVPAGSNIPPSDLKVSRIGFAEVPTTLGLSAEEPWKLSDVLAFGLNLGLVPIATAEAACSLAVFDAHTRLEDYREQFAKYYSVERDRYTPTRLTLGAKEISVVDLLPGVYEHHIILLKGPSGVGKTMIARQIGQDALAGFLPIFLQAKNFAGLLSSSVNAEVTLLGAASARAVVQDAMRLGLRLFIIVDGLNECAVGLRGPLLRAVNAAVRRYEALAVITSNIDIPSESGTALTEVAVAAPSLEQRREIAERKGRVMLAPDAMVLLASITTGLEAAVLGELGNGLPAGSSRFILFDTFIRRRAGHHATQVIALLSTIAHRLHEVISFSLSVREVDRLAEANNIPSAVVAHAISVGLLVTTLDRVSFFHELYLDASAAEAVVRRSVSPADIVKSLRSPKHRSGRNLIVGAIERPEQLAAVLGETEDAEIIRACLGGECGAAAREYAEMLVDRVLEKSVLEAEGLSFQLGTHFMLGAGIDDASVASWTRHEGAVLRAVPTFTWSEQVLSQVLAGMRAMDRQIAQARSELRQSAKEQGLKSIYSGMFANCHLYSQGSGPGMARISSVIASGMGRFDEKRDMAPVFAQIERTDLSPGELYLLLALFKGSGLEQHAELAVHLPRLFAERWKGAPYHLQLDMLDACHSSWKAVEPVRLALVDMLGSLELPDGSSLNSMLIDALSALGALEDDERNHAIHLRTLMREVLDAPGAEASPAQAWHLYYGQFDHPYAGAYCEVVSELDGDDKKTFLAAAATAAALEDSDLFTVPLIMQLAKLHDPAMAPLIVPWTRPPRADSVMRDEGVGAFRNAWIALGHLGHEFEPADPGPDEGAMAFHSYGQTLYWLNRHDLEPLARNAKAHVHLELLAAHRIDLVIGILVEAEYFNSWTAWDRLDDLKFADTVANLRGRFGTSIAGLCRAYLDFKGSPKTYFAHPDHERMLDYAIQLIGLHGEPSDIVALKRFAVHPNQGRAALEAIKAIEARLYSIN